MKWLNLCCSLLRRHEQLLSYIALSSAESSLAISHCLLDLHIHYPVTEEQQSNATSTAATPADTQVTL